MAKSPPTIRDVAQRAGVSVSTVSRILNGAETAISISAETRQKVLQASQSLAYRPHPGARLLRGKGANLLGLILRELDDLFFAQLVQVISQVAQEKGVEIVLGYARNDPDEAVRLSELMLDLRYCDGLILLGDLHESVEDRSFLSQMNQNMPLVQLCRGNKNLVADIPSVNVDNLKGTSLAMDYLMQLGHQRIAFLGSERLGDLHERQETYNIIMQNNFGTYTKEYLTQSENTLEGGYQAMSQLLSLPVPPTAVFASDDMMAIGAIRAAYIQQAKIPQDISIIGFDDINLAAYLTPSLSTIHQSTEILGSKAVQLILSLTADSFKESLSNHIVIEPELIIRDSCASPSRSAIIT